MKIYIRTLWGDDERPLWDNPQQRDALKNHLNDLGFYALTGAGNSVDVFSISHENAWDIVILEKSLDKIQKVWYALTHTRHA